MGKPRQITAAALAVAGLTTAGAPAPRVRGARGGGAVPRRLRERGAPQGGPQRVLQPLDQGRRPAEDRRVRGTQRAEVR
ncbi:hypothetical protein ACFSTC_62245 [Nonomuraea ferruginea]